MKICPKCSSQLDDNAKFCPRCGVELQAYNAENTESTTPTEPTVNNTAPQPQYQQLPYYTPPMPMYGTRPKAAPQSVSNAQICVLISRYTDRADRIFTHDRF